MYIISDLRLLELKQLYLAYNHGFTLYFLAEKDQEEIEKKS